MADAPVRSGLLDPRTIRALAAELNLHPSKQRGQNFVIDPNTVRRIVALAGVQPGEVVLEVGPGLGSLTPSSTRCRHGWSPTFRTTSPSR